MDISGLPRNSTDLSVANILEGTRQYFQGLPNSTGASSRLLNSSYTYQALGNGGGRSQEASTLGSHPGSQWRPPSDKPPEHASSMGPFMAALNQLQSRSVPASSSRTSTMAVPHQQVAYSHHQSFGTAEKGHNRNSISYTHANGYLNNRSVTVTSSSVTSDPTRYQYPSTHDSYYDSSRKNMLLSNAEAIARATPSKIFQYNDLSALNYNNISSGFSDGMLTSKEEPSLMVTGDVTTTYRAGSTSLSATVEPTSTNVEPKSDKKTKSDSPIDLSVKTVRQTADSTALDEFPDSSSTPKLPEIPSLMLPETKALPTYFETKKPSAPSVSSRLPSPIELNSFSPPTTLIPSGSSRIPSMPKESLMRVADSHIQQLSHKYQSSIKYPQSSYSITVQQQYNQARHPQKQQYHTPHSPRHQPQYPQMHHQVSRQYQQSQEHAHARPTQEAAYQHPSYPHAQASIQPPQSSVSSRPQNSHTSLSYQQQTSQLQQQSQMYQKMLKQQQQQQQQPSTIQHSSSTLHSTPHQKSPMTYSAQQVPHRSQHYQVIQQHAQDPQHAQQRHLQHQISVHQQKPTQHPQQSLPSIHRQPSPLHQQPTSLHPSPMHSQQSSPVVHSQQPSPILHPQQPSPVQHSQQPSPVLHPQQPSPILRSQQPSPIIHSQQPSPLHPQQRSPLHSQQPSPMYPQQPSPMHQQQPSPMHQQQPSPMHQQQPSPMHQQQQSPMHQQQQSPMHQQQQSPMHPQQPSPMHTQQPSPLHPQQPSPMHSQSSPAHPQQPSQEASPHLQKSQSSASLQNITPTPQQQDQPPAAVQAPSVHESNTPTQQTTTQQPTSSNQEVETIVMPPQQQPVVEGPQEQKKPSSEPEQAPTTQEQPTTVHEQEPTEAHQPLQDSIQKPPSNHQQSPAAPTDQVAAVQPPESPAAVCHKQLPVSATHVQQSSSALQQSPAASQQSPASSQQPLPVSQHEQAPAAAHPKQSPHLMQKSPSMVPPQPSSSPVRHQQSPVIQQQRSSSVIEQQQSVSVLRQQPSPVIPQQQPPSIMHQQSSTVHQQSSSSVHQQQTSPSMHSQQSSRSQQPAVSVHSQQPLPTHQHQVPAPHQQTSMYSQHSASLQQHSSMHQQQPSPVRQQQPSPVRQQQPSPMHHQQQSSIHQLHSSPLHQQQTSPMHHHQSSAMHQQQSSSLHHQHSTPGHPQQSQQSSSMHHQQSHIHHQQSASVHQQSASVHHQQPASVHHQQSSAHHQQQSSMHHHQQASLQHQQSVPVHHQSNSIHHQQSTPSVHQQHSSSMHQQPSSVHHKQTGSVHHQQPTSIQHHQQSSSIHHQQPSSLHHQQLPSHHQMVSTAQQQSSTLHQQHQSSLHQQVHQQPSVHPQHAQLQQPQHASSLHQQQASGTHQKPPSSSHHQQSTHHMRNISQHHPQYNYQQQLQHQQTYSQQQHQHQPRSEPTQKTHPHYQYLQQQQQSHIARQQSHMEQQQSHIMRQQSHMEQQHSHMERQQSPMERQPTRTAQYQAQQYKQGRLETLESTYPQYKQETPRAQHLSVQQQPTYSQHSRIHSERRIAYPQEVQRREHKLYNPGLLQPSKQPSEHTISASDISPKYSPYQMSLKRGSEIEVMGPPSKVPKMDIPSMINRSASMKDLSVSGLTQKVENSLEQQILALNYNGSDRNRYGMNSPSPSMEASVRSLLRNTLEQKQEQKMKYRPNDVYPTNKYPSSMQYTPRETTPPSYRHDISPKTTLPASHYPPTPPLSSSSPSISQQRTESSSPAGPPSTPVNHPLHVHVHSTNKEVPRMTPPAELDGLAASLAARIRTKAELKQMSPLPPSLPEKAAVVPSRTLTPGSNSSTLLGRDSTEKKDIEGATSVFEFEDTEEETGQLSLDSLRKSKIGQSPARHEDSSSFSSDSWESWDRFNAKVSDFVNDLQGNTNIKIKKAPSRKTEPILPMDDYFDVTSDEEVTFEPVPEVKRIYPEVPIPTMFDVDTKKAVKKERGSPKKKKGRRSDISGARSKRRDSITKYTGQCTSDSDEGSDATYVPTQATRRRSARTYRSDSESVSDFEDELAEMRRRPKKLSKTKPKAQLTPKKEQQSTTEGDEAAASKEVDIKVETQSQEATADVSKEIAVPEAVPPEKKMESQEEGSTPKKALDEVKSEEVEGEAKVAPTESTSNKEDETSEKETLDEREQKKSKRSKKKKLKHKDGKKARRQVEEQELDQRKVQPVKLRLVRKDRTHERASVGERLRQRRRIEKKTKGGRLLRIREVEPSEESGDERDEGKKAKSDKSDLKLKIKADRKPEEKIEENKENPDEEVEDGCSDGTDPKSRRFALREKRTTDGSSSSKKPGMKKMGDSKLKKGHNNFFSPGWENDLVNFKKSIRMPPNLIRVTKPAVHVKGQKRKGAVMAAKVAKEKMQKAALGELEVAGSPRPDDIHLKDSDMYNLVENFKKSEDSSPAQSECDGSETKGDDVDCGGFVASLSKDSVISKLENNFLKQAYKQNLKQHRTRSKVVEKVKTNSPLIPTPGLTDDPKASATTGFRKQTLEAFAELSPNKNGFKDFAPEILETKTRTQTKALKHEVTIKQVFGQDLPEKPSPGKSKKTKVLDGSNSLETTPPEASVTVDASDGKPVKEAADTVASVSCDNGEVLSTLSAESTASAEMPMPEIVPARRPFKLKYMKRKLRFRSGFDYMRKRNKKKLIETDEEQKERKRLWHEARQRLGSGPGGGLEADRDPAKEVRNWALNKSLGETALHRAAKLGFYYVAAYCIDMGFGSVSSRNNAGISPLHVACARGNLEVARLLLEHGADPNSNSPGGVRPLHEAVDYMHTEMCRLLLSYGADPCLITYSGLSPVSLCKEAPTRATIQGHLSDIQGLPATPWEFKGSASCLDVRPTGFSVLETIPPPDCDEKSDEENSEGTEPNSGDCDLSDLCRFQMSDSPIISTYQVKGQEGSWALKEDLPQSTLNLSDLQTIQMSTEKFVETARCTQIFHGRTFPDGVQVVMVKLVGRAALPLEEVSFRDG